MKKNISSFLSNLPSKLKESKDYVIGLDRGTEAIRYVVTSIKTGEIVEWGSSSPTNKKTSSKELKKDTSPSEVFLRDLARQYPRKKIQAIRCNLRDPAVVSGNVEINEGEGFQQDKVRTAISNELPHKLEDASYAYHKISMNGQGSDENSKQSCYHYVSVPKDLIPKMVKPVEENFLMAPSLIPEGEIHRNLISKLSFQAKGEMVAIINIGRSITSISIIGDSQVVFQRDISLAGQDLTRAIFVSFIKDRSADQEANLSKAEEMKRKLYLSGGAAQGEQQKAQQSMAGVLSAWINDIRLSINHFKGKRGETIKKVYLMGGGANLNGLADHMSQELGIKTEILKFSNESAFPIAPTLDSEEFKNSFHEYATAVSLANMPADTVNLTPVELRSGRVERLAEIVIRSCPILIGAILLTWFVFLVAQSTHLQNGKRISEEQQLFLSKVEKPYLEMIRWELFLREADSSAALTSKLLMAVSKFIPKNVLVSTANINRKSGKMTIRGTVHGDAKNRAITMAEFSKSLTDSGYFSHVKTSITKGSADQTAQGRFRLNGKLRTVGKQND